jgi:hypothetical protein
MPTALRVGRFRFFFYSSDKDEPVRVHVEVAGDVAKFWLEPVKLERSGRMEPRDLRMAQGIVEEHQEELVEAWHAYFQD